MRKSFIIIIFLLSINITSPNSQIFAQIIRHQVVFVQEDKSKDLTDNELLKNKVIMFMRFQFLMIRVAAVNSVATYNTS